jgi:subtilisin-like proprotein convertase family protein
MNIDSGFNTAFLGIADNYLISDLNVQLTINHSSVGDLIVSLRGPNAAESFLAFFNGGSGDDFSGTTFDDSASTSINGGSAPFTGTYRPVSPLSVFNGISTMGGWNLSISNSAGNLGSLQSWRIFGEGTAVQQPPAVVPEPASIFLLGAGVLGIAAKVRRRRKL